MHILQCALALHGYKHIGPLFINIHISVYVHMQICMYMRMFTFKYEIYERRYLYTLMSVFFSYTYHVNELHSNAHMHL